MKASITVLLGLSIYVAGAGVASGQEHELGRNVAAIHCQACHGANGVSNAPTWPNLAGQKRQYLAKQLRDFRSGSRSDAVMGPIAQRLSDEEVAAVAAYYSSL